MIIVMGETWNYARLFGDITLSCVHRDCFANEREGKLSSIINYGMEFSLYARKIRANELIFKKMHEYYTPITILFYSIEFLCIGWM